MLVRSLSFFVALTLLFGCRKVQDAPNAESISFKEYRLGLPLIESSLSIEDMVQKYGSDDDTAEFYLEQDPNCCYQFVYVDKYDFSEAENHIQLPPTIAFGAPNMAIVLTVPGGAAPSVPSPAISFTFTFPGGALFNAELDKLYFKAGDLNVRVQKTDQDPSNRVNMGMSIQFDDLTKQGQPLTLNMSNISSVQATDADNTPFSIKDYVWIIGLKPVPTMRVTFTIKNLSTTNQQANVSTISILGIDIKNPKWSLIRGRLGTVNIPVTDQDNASQLDLNRIFLNVFNGNAITDADTNTFRFNFVNPSIKFEFQSSYGLPVAITNTLIGLNKKGASSGSDFVESVTRFIQLGPVPINAAINTSEDFAQTRVASSEYQVGDSKNTDKLPALQSLLQPGPRVVENGVILSTNATNNTGTDFIFDKSKLSSTTTVRIPIFGYVSLFNMATTVDYPFSKEKATNTVTGSSLPNITLNSVNFKFDYVNNMPLNIVFQAYFLDKQGNVLDSLFNTEYTTSDNRKRYGFLIEGGKIDANGNPSAPTIPSVPIAVKFDQNRYLNIHNTCSKVLLTGNMFSTGFDLTNISKSASVKIRPQDKLKIKLSILADNVDVSFGNVK